MNAFLEAHGSKIQGMLSCFDRVLFRGYHTLSAALTMHDVEFAKAHSEVNPLRTVA